MENADDGPQCYKGINEPGGFRFNNQSDLVHANERYQKTAMKNLFNESFSRIILGFHSGTSAGSDIVIGQYAYSQTDYVLDFKSGTIFLMETTGSGHYVGAPNGVSVEKYFGFTNVHGIPLAASVKQAENYLAGPNLDFAGDVAGDILPDIEASIGKGISLDLDPITDMRMLTTSGQMYTTETKFGVGGSIIPYPIDLGFQGGNSYTTAQIYYQIPWWPFQ